MEREDEEVKRLRRELQNQNKEERSRQLEEENSCWRAKKTRELELQEVKRRRPSETDEDRRAWGERRRPKKLKYALIGEDWGEEEDEKTSEEVWEEQVTPATKPHPRKKKIRFSTTTTVSSPKITDYFSPEQRRLRGVGVDDELWGTEDDQEDWYRVVKQYVDVNIKNRGSSKEIATKMIWEEDKNEEEDQHWREEQESKDNLRVNIKDPEQLQPPSTINDDQDHPAEKAPVPTYHEVGDQDRVEDGAVDPVPDVTPPSTTRRRGVNCWTIVGQQQSRRVSRNIDILLMRTH